MTSDLIHYVIPSTYSGQFVILFLLAWFGVWCVRLVRQARILGAAAYTVRALDACTKGLKEYQIHLDRSRQAGTIVDSEDHGKYFQTAVEAAYSAAHAGPISHAVVDHLETIFLAGCDESELDAAELSSSTMQALLRNAQSLRLELGLFVLVGLLGTLLGLAETLGSIRAQETPPEQLVESVQHILSGLGNAFAPAMWGVFTSILGGWLYARFQTRSVNECATTLRRATNLKWMPKLYPTVGQRASQWALQTLQHAIKVTDAAKTIEADTAQLRASMSEAKEAASAFAAGMRSFTIATTNADHVLEGSVKNLGVEIQKFSMAIGRWSQFEQEILRFYETVAQHQGDMAARQQHLAEASGKLQESAAGVRGAMESMVRQVLAQTGALQSAHTAQMTAFETALGEALQQHEKRLNAITKPVVALDDRMQALSAPFDNAAAKLVEVATNLLKLNDSSVRDLHAVSAQVAAAMEALRTLLEREHA